MSDLWWLLREYASILWKIESGRDYDDFERVRIHNEIQSYLGIKDDTVKAAKLESLLHNFPYNIRDGYLMGEAERIIKEVILK